MVKKDIFLKLIFVLLFFLLFVGIQRSKAGTSYTTECGENITIGQYFTRTCRCGSDCTYSCRGARCGGQWVEYRAEQTNCGTAIKRRFCKGMPTGWDWCCGYTDCTVVCTPWEGMFCDECGSWQKSKSRTDSAREGSQYGGVGLPSAKTSCSVLSWGLSKPKCECDANCIDQPLSSGYSLRYYKNSIYPKDPWQPSQDYAMSKDNIYLPVKIDWDDVRGFKDGWQYFGEKKVVEKCSQNYADGNRRCIVNYPTSQSSCKIDSRVKCLNEIIARIPPLLTLEDFKREYYACLEREEKNCESINANTSLGCTDHCSGPQIPQIQQCLQETEYIKSYVITIKSEDGRGIFYNNATSTSYTTTTNRSEFIPPNSCFFLPGSKYSFTVKACCKENGTDCGQESAPQYFTTNRAPELIYPHDADWAGERKTEKVPNPYDLTLRWCRFEDKNYYPGKVDYDGKWYYYPLSFKFSLFYAPYEETNRNNYKCIPDFQVGNKCELILKAKEGSGTVFPKPEFVNKEYAIGKYITKDTSYAWKISACKDESANECTDFSQEWLFSTERVSSLQTPRIVYPPYDGIVGLPVIVQWAPVEGANSYLLSLYYKDGSKVFVNKLVTSLTYPLDWPTLKPEKTYKVEVQPCWDFEGKKCEGKWGFSYFTVTGQPPEIIFPLPGSTTIPVEFKWKEVPGAQSYKISVRQGGTVILPQTIVKDTKYTLDYPTIKQKQTYTFEILTCAKEEGEFCGSKSSSLTFSTLQLSPPSNPSPKDGETIFTLGMPKWFSFSSVTGAKYYMYEIVYVQKAQDETREDCNPSENPIISKIISEPKDFVTLKCLGDYKWRAKSCFDADCKESSEWSSWWKFKLEPSLRAIGGLVPCGRSYDDPNTPWDEMEFCEIRHIFLFLQIILDFLFFRVGLIILAILILISGGIYLLSLYLPETFGSYPATQIIKQMWKYAGIGYLIVFFAWFLVNILLGILGYKMLIFGRWWEIKF
jgi:hypothetical protein